MNLFDFDNDPPAVLFPKEVVPPMVVRGWWKEYQGAAPATGVPAPLPTLNHNPHDGHVYHPAMFRLADGVCLGTYPGGCWGLRVPGEKDLVSLYDAVRLGLAKEGL